MAISVAMCMRRLFGGGRKYCNMPAAVAVAAEARRFHPNIGGYTSILRGGESLIPTAGKSPLPLLIVPPEMVTDMGGHATNTHYNFMRIEKQEDDDYGVHKKLFMVEKSNKLPWEKLLLPDDAICRGSSHGWFAFEHPSTSEVGLFNPFIPKKQVFFPYIPLPRSNTIQKGFYQQIYKDDNSSYSPSLLRYGEHYGLQKFALSCAPSLVGGGDCIVVGITQFYKRLVFCKLGDSAWTRLKGSLRNYSDVVYFSKDGRFYAVKESSGIDTLGEQPHHIESWDFTCCPPKYTLIQPSIDIDANNQFPFNPQGWRATKRPLYEDGIRSCGKTKRYLVDASGELLLVLRFKAPMVGKDGFVTDRSEYNDSDKDRRERDWNNDLLKDEERIRNDITVGFAVYKMVDSSENKWEPVESLGDKSLFLGLNHSFSVSTHDLPQVMQNSIYFTDDRDTGYPCFSCLRPEKWGYDSGVYNMEDGFISGILPSSLEEIKHHPLWVLPNPNMWM